MTPKQRRFCDEYISSGNATDAAQKAGYSPKTAYSQGQRLLKKVELKAYIESELEKLHSTKIANAEEVLEYLTSVMRGENKEQTLRLDGEGVQVVDDIDVPAKERIKAAELLGRINGLFAPGGAQYGKTQQEDDPLTKSLREEAERLDALREAT